MDKDSEEFQAFFRMMMPDDYPFDGCENCGDKTKTMMLCYKNCCNEFVCPSCFVGAPVDHLRRQKERRDKEGRQADHRRAVEDGVRRGASRLVDQGGATTKSKGRDTREGEAAREEEAMNQMEIMQGGPNGLAVPLTPVNMALAAYSKAQREEIQVLKTEQADLIACIEVLKGRIVELSGPQYPRDALDL